MEHFREWAGSIANSYMSCGTTPTEELKKFAQTQELSPDQIHLLATETNKLIHQHKYASAGDNKYHAADFPFADSKEVIQSLQVDGGEQKVAAELPDPVVGSSGPDPFDMFGVKEDGLTKQAEFEKTAGVRSNLKSAQEKTALLRDKTNDQAIMAKYAAEAGERQFIKEARQLCLSGNSPKERLDLLGQIHHFTKCASMEETAKPALAKLAHVLMKEGLVEPQDGRGAVAFFMDKEADEKAPEGLINHNIDSQVVNGDHPLYITLKTFRDRKNALELHRDRHETIDDKARILGQKARAL